MAIVQVWQADPNKPPQYSEPYLYVATGLAALVGGIFAVAFGVKKVSAGPATPNLTTLGPYQLRHLPRPRFLAVYTRWLSDGPSRMNFKRWP